MYNIVNARHPRNVILHMKSVEIYEGTVKLE